MYYYLTHAPMSFYFKHAPRDFVVEELPLYDFSNQGEHLVLKVRKKSLSTWEMISKIANYLGINAKEIGYAGLKDKHALTVQYISVHKRFEKNIASMDLENIKVLQMVYHDNKIRTGHLKGNRFFIRLKKVSSADAAKIKSVLKHIQEHGMPNYFGFQRFGNDGENFKHGQAICQEGKKEKNKKLHRLYINAYQSKQFNDWLDARFEAVQLSPTAKVHPLGLLHGDVAMHYPYGKAFIVEDIPKELERIKSKDIVVSGLLAGKRAIRATHEAYEIERSFDVETPINGERRYAWVYPTDIESSYQSEDAWMHLHFTLPKGSYATVLLEQLAKQNIQTLSQGL